MDTVEEVRDIQLDIRCMADSKIPWGDTDMEQHIVDKAEESDVVVDKEDIQSMGVEVGEEVDPVEEDLEEVVDVEGLGEVVAVDLFVEVVGAVVEVVEGAAVAVVVALQFEPMDVAAGAVEVDFEDLVQGLVHRDKAEVESCTSSMFSIFFFCFCFFEVNFKYR